MFLIKPAFAHGGGLDSDGGHNCYVGSCEGTYHFHNGSHNSQDVIGDNFGFIIFLVIVCIGYFSLRKDNKGRLAEFKNEPIKNILEPVGLGGLVDKSPEYREKKLLRIHGPYLFEIEQYSGSQDIRQECLKLIERSIELQNVYSSKYKYFKTKNVVQSTPEYPDLSERSNIVLFLVKLGEELISIELVANKVSAGFLHPKLIEVEGKKIFELDDRAKWQIASDIKEITFEEFSKSWKERTEGVYENTRWSRWLNNYYNNNRN